MEPVKKRELSLQELKDIEFGLLKEFGNFCNNNNIRYFLAYGTLLGAIRYKGFIPWDDDVDVLVPRNDYNRLVKLYKDNGKRKLYSTERNDSFGYPFAKLCDMTTLKVEGNQYHIDNGVLQGVEIDIFPLDYWNDNIEKAKDEVAKLKRYKYWLNIAKMTSLKAHTPFKQLAFYMMHIFARNLVGTQHWCKCINRIATSQSQVPSQYVGDKVWAPYNEKDIIPAAAFKDAVEVEFEGVKFPAPIGYDTYLTCLYGDYLPEPPKEKQKTHHSFTAYKLNDEE